MANTRTVAFARVSSKAQEEEGYSLDAQPNRIYLNFFRLS